MVRFALRAAEVAVCGLALAVVLLHIEAVEDFCMSVLCSDFVEDWLGT